MLDPAELPFATPPGSRVAVHVAAAVTHTIGGVRVDTRARVLDANGGDVAESGSRRGQVTGTFFHLIAEEG